MDNLAMQFSSGVIAEREKSPEKKKKETVNRKYATCHFLKFGKCTRGNLCINGHPEAEKASIERQTN